MKTLIVDDHALFREGLKFLLRELSEAVEIEEAEDCQSAIDRSDLIDFDLVLLDLKMPDANGLDALTRFKAAHPSPVVVVLSGEGSRSFVLSAIHEGARGFIPKASTPPTLIHALELVLAGNIYLPAELLDTVETEESQAPEAAAVILDKLTNKQREVLRYLLEGKPNKIIADLMHITDNTVKAHLSAVYQVLEVRSRTLAVVKAAKLGLIVE